MNETDTRTLETRRTSPAGTLSFVILALMTLGTVAGMLLIDDSVIVGALGLLLMLELLALRLPVALALLIPALIGLFALGGGGLIASLMSRKLYETAASWELSVLPMFIFMGFLVANSGISSVLYRSVQQWLWWLPGGLAIGTNVAGVALSAVSGSTIATTFALGRAGGPEMLSAGYHRRFVLVAVMSPGMAGNLIPPSIMLVVYAGVASTPIGPQLIAGVLPGILIGAVFSVILFGAAVFFGRKIGGRPDRSRAASFPTMIRSAAKAWPVPVLITIVLGGMLSGLFTATEAAAGAAAVALLIVLPRIVRQRDWPPLREAVMGTFRVTGMIFLLLIGAVFLTEMFALTGLSNVVKTLVDGAGFDRVTFLLVMVVVYLLLGTALDTLSMMLLTVPVLLPTLAALEISPLFFGVFVVLLAEVGALTPPVGVLLYMIERMFQDPKVNLGQRVTLGDVFAAVAWVLPAAIVALLLLIFFPEIATWLPDQMRNTPIG